MFINLLLMSFTIQIHLIQEPGGANTTVTLTRILIDWLTHSLICMVEEYHFKFQFINTSEGIKLEVILIQSLSSAVLFTYIWYYISVWDQSGTLLFISYYISVWDQSGSLLCMLHLYLIYLTISFEMLSKFTNGRWTWRRT